jgi:alkanesulfonate monooxygenase SsuD/methylene tetrahydromethanopterin reductase-like flavin-dependent oxidoreductase (luciferase family)
VRRAGQLADGFIYIPDTGAEDEVKAALEHLAAGAREAGRDPEEIAFVWLQNTFVSREPDALAAARSGIAHQLGAYGAWDEGHDTPEHDSLEPPQPTDAELRSSTIAGTPDEVAAALRKVLAPVADRRDVHLIVRLHYPGMDLATAAGALEMFGREVLPALRSG